jgi:putative ABC transport system permease protein
MTDLRFAFRQLLKNPGFALVAVLTLALGIGANTGMFSVVDALLLRRLPYPDPERLVWVEEVSKDGTQEAWGGHFLDWQEQSQTLDGIGAYDATTWTLTGAGEAERVEVGTASAGFFPLLGVQPLSPGRNFSRVEDKPGGPHVALISHGLWQRRYRGQPDTVGGSVTLNDVSYTIIGVLPENFRFVNSYEVWVPLALDPQAEMGGTTRSYQSTIARLKPGVSLAQAQVEMDTLRQRYEAARPQGRSRIESRTQLVPLQEHLLGDTRRPLVVLLGAVGLVLLIGCANVANLLLARAVTRQKELSIRAALGASRWRLVRQLMTECLLLALSGGAVGLLLAYWLTGLLSTFNLAETVGQMARLATITIDLRVFGFAFLVSILTGVLFGLMPAWRLSQPALNVSLREGGRGSKSHGRGLHGVLMVAEIALAMVLLAGAGLLIRSFVRLLEVNPGYRADRLLTARFQLPPRYQDKVARVQFYERLLERVATLPGVESAGATSHLPLSRYNLGGTLRVEGRVPAPGEREPSAPFASVNPGYFRTMGIGLRSGRLFTDGDTAGAPNVALLSESLARRLFPNGEAVGKRLRVSAFGEEWTTIIGVVTDIRHQGLERGPEEAVYLSFRQLARPGMALLLRSRGDPLSLTPALRSAVREIDPALPLYEVMTMEARLSNSIAGRRFNLLLIGSFAALALVLAGIGVYGVIDYVVTERTHEVGIRMALGADRSDVLALVLRQGMGLSAIGIGIGVAAALALTRVLTSSLYEIKPGDPMTFVGVSGTLLLVAFVATWMPARRAARVDPMVALRSE